MNETNNVPATSNATDELDKALIERVKLDEKIEALRKESREDALKTVRKLCETHLFTATDLRGALKVKGATRTAKKSPRRRKPS